MSRIGKSPIAIPEGVAVAISEENLVTIKGPLGELSQQVVKSLSVKTDDANIIINRSSEEKQEKAFHGLFRSLLSNMVEGVTKGYKKELELVGVGYRASNQGQILQLSLGYSHNIMIQLPSEIKLETISERGQNPRVALACHDKQLLGHYAAKIRSLRKPEPYKGKGVKYVGEYIRRKAGKSVAK